MQCHDEGPRHAVTKRQSSVTSKHNIRETYINRHTNSGHQMYSHERRPIACAQHRDAESGEFVCMISSTDSNGGPFCKQETPSRQARTLQKMKRADVQWRIFNLGGPHHRKHMPALLPTLPCSITYDSTGGRARGSMADLAGLRPMNVTTYHHTYRGNLSPIDSSQTGELVTMILKKIRKQKRTKRR